MRAFLLPAVIFVATLISAGASAQSSPGLEISSSGKLRVASFTNNILFIKKSDGRIVGAAVDLGNFIARKLGVTFEPIVYANPKSYTSSFGTGAWEISRDRSTHPCDRRRNRTSVRISSWSITSTSRRPDASLRCHPGRSRRRQDRSRAERPAGFVADPHVEIRPARARAWWLPDSSSCCAAARPTSSRQTAKSSTPRLTACRVRRSCPGRSTLSGWR